MYSNLKIPEGSIDDMKAIVYGDMYDKLSKKYGSDSFSQSELLDRYLKAKTNVGLFRNPGQAPFKVITAGQTIGRVTGLNAAKNWIKLNYPTSGDFWIINKPENYLIVGASLTESERNRAREIGAATATQIKKDTAPVAYIGQKAANTAQNVAKGVVETTDTILSFGSVIGSNLRLILITAIVLVVIYVFLKFKKEM